jgi:hypothetical protein
MAVSLFIDGADGIPDCIRSWFICLMESGFLGMGIILPELMDRLVIESELISSTGCLVL